MTPFGGSAYRPGDVPYSNLDHEIHMKLPVLPDQKIFKGDIVTLSAEPEPGYAVRAGSVGDRGDARNWGDVSRGAFMARDGPDGPVAADGTRTIRVMPPAGQITTLLEEGITVGSLVGVDLRIDTGTERIDRDSAVTSTHGSPDEKNIGHLWQQARLIPHGRRDEPLMRKALLGRVQEISSRRERGNVMRSGHNDCAIVRGRM